MTLGSLALVNRNVARGGATVAAIRAIRASDMTPGPLGIRDTKPIAAAPWSSASLASAIL
jgi:hypothetical protein